MELPLLYKSDHHRTPQEGNLGSIHYHILSLVESTIVRYRNGNEYNVVHNP